MITVGQAFYTSNIPLELDNGINYTDCYTTGTKAIEFTVSGLQNLSSSLALASIDLSIDLTCGGDLRNFQLWIKSPAETCMRIYNPGSSSVYTTSFPGTLNLSLRDGSCLNEPNVDLISWAVNTNKFSSGNFGVFRANALTSMSNFFSGINPNGTWTIYASENTLYAPCISAASILFANPVVASQTSLGESCENPIVWSGQPICTSTLSKTPSAQSPGYYVPSNGPSGYEAISGNNCQWNAANNNDVWVQFTATGSGNICITISGLDGLLQSILVKDANADGDNMPCTQKVKTKQDGDENWQVVSCPTTNSVIYDGNNVGGGTDRNQQHCFPAQLNETFYLVIDGTSGT